MSNHTPSKVRDGITYPFPNFNRVTVEVWEYRPSSYWACDYLSMLGSKLTNVIKRGLVIDSGNALFLNQYQSFTWTNDDISPAVGIKQKRPHKMSVIILWNLSLNISAILRAAATGNTQQVIWNRGNTFFRDGIWHMNRVWHAYQK